MSVQLQTRVVQLLESVRHKLIISKTADGIQVSRYLIKFDGDLYNVTLDDVIIDTFATRSSAVAAAVSLHNRNNVMYKDIVEIDNKIFKHQRDLIFYERSKRIAEQKGNAAKWDVAETRADLSRWKIKHHKKSLRAILKKVNIA